MKSIKARKVPIFQSFQQTVVNSWGLAWREAYVVSVGSFEYVTKEYNLHINCKKPWNLSKQDQEL